MGFGAKGREGEDEGARDACGTCDRWCVRVGQRQHRACQILSLSLLLAFLLVNHPVCSSHREDVALPFGELHVLDHLRVCVK